MSAKQIGFLSSLNDLCTEIKKMVQNETTNYTIYYP